MPSVAILLAYLPGMEWPCVSVPWGLIRVRNSLNQCSIVQPASVLLIRYQAVIYRHAIRVVCSWASITICEWWHTPLPSFYLISSVLCDMKWYMYRNSIRVKLYHWLQIFIWLLPLIHKMGIDFIKKMHSHRKITLWVFLKDGECCGIEFLRSCFLF